MCTLLAPLAVTMLALVTPSAGAAAASPPNIVMALVDDNGWAGVGYNNPHLDTPVLDELAAGGLKLSSHYVYKYCAPTRGSFLTGRLPYRLAATRANFIPWTLPDGTHLNYSMLPKKLAAAGYRSVHVGKWHQGLYTPLHTPVGRGFNHSLGFLEGGEDHNTSKTFGNYCRRGEVDLSIGKQGGSSGTEPFPYEWPVCKEWKELNGTAVHEFYDPASVDIKGYNPWPARRFDSAESCRRLCDNRIGCAGFSWRRDDPSHQYYHECFLVAKDGGAHKSVSGFVSAVCADRRQTGATTIAAKSMVGRYTGETFTAEAVRVIGQHGPGGSYQGVPLFLYLALHDTHGPLEVPWKYAAPYATKWPDDAKRVLFSGMIGFVDAAMKNVTDALRDAQMWDNTLFVWSNDNGSPVWVGGSNHPLRGAKGSNWEGGVRVPTFVTGGVLPPEMRGQTHSGLMHIADWVATFAGLAGIDPTAGEPYAPAPLDSIDAWPWISGRVPHSSRTEVVLDHRMFLNVSQQRDSCFVVNVTQPFARQACVSAAVRNGTWKLVLGPEAQNGWFGWFSPNVSKPINKSSPVLTDKSCFPDPCLFDLGASMTEHDDVAAERPDIVASLLARVVQIANEEYHPPVKNPPIDLDGYCAAIDANSNFVGPWMQVPAEYIELP